MASNALSKKRGFMTRPDVCHTPENPGRCEPPEVPEPPLPPRTCSLSPATWEIEVGDGDAVDLSACCPALPHAQELTRTWEVEHGEVTHGDLDVTNCDDTENLQYSAPDFECVDTITVIVTWSDGGQCTAVSTVTVIEENGD